MNSKDIIIQEFNASVDEMKQKFLDKLKKLFESSFAHKAESEKSSENEQIYLPSKRKNSSPKSKLNKLKKFEDKTKEPKTETKDPEESSQNTSNEIPPEKNKNKDLVAKSKPEKQEPVVKTQEISSNEPQSSVKPVEPMIAKKDLSEKPKNSNIEDFIKELGHCDKDRTIVIVDSLVSLLETDFNIENFTKIKAGKTIKSLYESENDQELKKKYKTLIESMTKLVKSSTTTATNWGLIHKQLNTAHIKKNDSEISATFNKIAESYTEKIESTDMTIVENIFKIVNSISKDWGNQAIQQKARSIMVKYKEKLPRSKSVDIKPHIADRLEGILPGVSKKY
jgi:hypothetical protein